MRVRIKELLEALPHAQGLTIVSSDWEPKT